HSGRVRRRRAGGPGRGPGGSAASRKSWGEVTAELHGGELHNGGLRSVEVTADPPDMAPRNGSFSDDPVVARIQLGILLRELRQDAERTAAQACKHLSCSPAKMSM